MVNEADRIQTSKFVRAVGSHARLSRTFYHLMSIYRSYNHFVTSRMTTTALIKRIQCFNYIGFLSCTRLGQTQKPANAFPSHVAKALESRTGCTFIAAAAILKL